MTFLVTTPIESFWNKEQKLIFLGEWCKLYERRHIWETLDHVQMPLYWQNHQQIMDAVEICDGVYKRTLKKLTEFLNEYNGIDESFEYYHIVMGNWLDHYIQISYDRFLSISQVLDRFPDLETVVLDPEDYHYPVHLYEWIVNVSESDRFNLQIYSRVLEGMGYAFPRKKLDLPLINLTRYSTPAWGHGEALFYKISELISKVFWKKRITVVSPYFKYGSLKKTLQLIWRSRFQVQFNTFAYPITIQLHLDRHIRRRGLDLGDSPFERMLGKIIIGDIPQLHLEGLKAFREQVSKLRFPESDAYYTTTSIHNNHIFKFFVARMKGEKRFFFRQHGGGEGIDYYNMVELYERLLADRFYTFGWKDGENTKPLPYANPAHITPPLPGEGRLLYTISEYSRYFYRISYQPTADDFLHISFADTITFLDAFQDDRTLLVRSWPPQGYKWCIKSRIQDCFPDMDQDDLSETFPERLKKARIHVTHHIGTAFLESISMNVPTVVFLSSKIYRFRAPAVSIMGQLEACGILHYSVDKAIEHVRSIEHDPQFWWNKQDVLSARKSFIHHYNRSSDQWMDVWVAEFRDVLDKPL